MAAVAVSAAILAAQSGTPPRAAATEYPVHVRAGKATIGAEYLVHSFSGSGQTFVAPGYLVIEVAVFPPKRESAVVSAGRFTLKVNGKREIYPQPAGFVAAALKYADWETPVVLEAGAGAGNSGVMLGGPPRTERFPGDQRPSATRLPAPPRAPEQTPGGIERQPAVRAEEVVTEAALPEGINNGPVSGYLYFAFKGKAKSVKSLELIYREEQTTTRLRLMP